MKQGLVTSGVWSDWNALPDKHTQTHFVSTTLPNIYKIEREIGNMKPSASAQQHYIWAEIPSVRLCI